MSKNVMHFGSFLVRKQLISADQLLDLLDLRASTGKPVGRILLEMGALNVKQVFQVVDRQLDDPRRFGEIAVALDLCTAAEIAVALQYQVEHRPRISDLVVELGWLSPAVMAEVNYAYRVLKEGRKAS